MENALDARSIDALLARFPFLLDKTLPYRHWREETFKSDKARSQWVEPDLVPLPRAPGPEIAGRRISLFLSASEVSCHNGLFLLDDQCSCAAAARLKA
jgi:hypothetical protein